MRKGAQRVPGLVLVHARPPFNSSQAAQGEQNVPDPVGSPEAPACTLPAAGAPSSQAVTALTEARARMSLPREPCTGAGTAPTYAQQPVPLPDPCAAQGHAGKIQKHLGGWVQSWPYHLSCLVFPGAAGPTPEPPVLLFGPGFIIPWKQSNLGTTQPLTGELGRNRCRVRWCGW